MTKHLRKIAIGLVIICFLCGTCSYFAISFLMPMDTTCWEAETFQHFVLEDHAKFKFPASAQEIKVVTKAGSSWCVMAVRFEMQPSDLNQFSASSHVGNLGSTTPINWGDLPHESLAMQLGLTTQNIKSYLFGSTKEDYFNQQFC